VKHKLDLLGNAYDSLNEGLRKFHEGGRGTTNAYKFAVLHVAHFVELYFKQEVVRRHPLLIYKNPFARRIADERTIGLWEAMQFLENDGVVLPASLRPDLEWLKKLRNDIEHSHFEMDLPEVRRTIGRLIRATNAYATSENLPAIQQTVGAEWKELYETLLDEYEASVEEVRQGIRDEGANATSCGICYTQGVAVDDGHTIACRLCKETDTYEECAICFQKNRRSEMSVWNDEHPADGVSYACVDCEERVFGSWLPPRQS
jgi:hypothetical protein